MDSQVKQRALKDAVELAGVAFGTASQSSAPFQYSELCAEFLETLYQKLCELYSDALQQ